MITNMDRTLRVIYLSLQMAEADKDHPQLSVEELFSHVQDQPEFHLPQIAYAGFHE